MKNKLIFTQSINYALDSILAKNNKSICMGLGINDPKRIFSTTSNLLEKYGKSRIIEPPTSENALTGIAFGLSLRGYSICLIHQRFDFALLSLDQIINTASKWKFMFGNDSDKHQFLIRLIVGRGWGQGPTHSQSYHSFLSSLPGLDVLYPYDSNSAYHSIVRGMESGKPTIIIEHRWLHNSVGYVMLNQKYFLESRSLQQIREGNSYTVFVYGYMVPEALKASDILLKKYNIKLDLFTTVDLTNVSYEKLIDSLNITKRVLLIECYTLRSSVVNDISTVILSNKNVTNKLESFDIISLDNSHESTSFFKTKIRYNNYIDIIKCILSSYKIDFIPEVNNKKHDIPGEWFKGPF